MIFSGHFYKMVLDGTKTSTIRHADKRCPKVGQIVAVQPGRGKKAGGHVQVTAVTPIGAYGGLDELTYDQLKRDGFECPPHENAWAALRETLGTLNRCDPDEWAWKLIEFELVKQ